MDNQRARDFRPILLSCITVVAIIAAAVIQSAYAEDRTDVGIGGSAAATPVQEPSAAAAPSVSTPNPSYAFTAVVAANAALAAVADANASLAAVADANASLTALVDSDADADALAAAKGVVDAALAAANAAVDAAVAATIAANAVVGGDKLGSSIVPHEPTRAGLLTKSSWSTCFDDVALDPNWYADAVARVSPPNFWKWRSLAE